MYPVSANFHTLAIADSPKTRCRIYFISDAVNCWDDNDVQTNGTLLIGAVGDTDSNGRIGQGGVTVTEIFNKDKNLTLGGTVSYQIGMTLVNSDGALNNFAFGRCKVYLDVYDDANSTWLPCPLGVFRIELPVKRKVQLITASGYDQMQALNATADTWWNGLNFTSGLTIENILNSMVAQLGLHLSATSRTSMVNKTLSFTTPPIDSVERTYRDILGWIAEATGTVAHFNRDGELDMRQYLTPQIGGNNIVIDTDTTGNQCLSIDVAEYSVSKIDALTIKLTTSDQGVTVGSGTNVYTIMDNPFLYGPDVATIQGKLTPIYNRLSAYATYSPISTRLIYDWSIEAGDIIYILNNSATYNMPIFQQKMVWRGGYVTSELISSGDTVRPQVSSSERETYRYNVEMATKVGDNEIISKINQTAEQIQIQASKVNLTGYITATNLATAGQTVINGGNITTGELSADRINGGTLTVGGANNQNGIIRILDSSGNEAGSITNTQFYTHRTNNGILEEARLTSGYLQLVTDGTPALNLGRDTQGGGAISLRDAAGNPRIVMFAQNNSIELLTSDGNAAINCQQNVLAFYSSNNSSRLILSPANIGTINADGKPDFRMSPGFTPDKKDIELFYIDTDYHDAVELGKTATDAHLRLYSPDNLHNIILDTQNGSIFKSPVTDAAGLTVQNGITADNATVNGLTAVNATVNGVLDVTPRRCEATLSAAGWYRAIVYNAYDTDSAQGASGEIVTIKIVYTSQVSVQHEISLWMSYGKVAFLNETSHGTTNLVDKIRYTYAGAVGYVDIHITSSSSVTYNVSFEVASRTYAQGLWVAGTLTSVADSPSGETVLKEHTFAANTDGDTSFTAMGKTWYFRKRNGVVYIDAPDAMTPTTSGGNSIGTLPSEFRPYYTTRLVAANAEGAYKVLLINTDGSVSAFCYTTVGQSTPYSITGSYLAI